MKIIPFTYVLDHVRSQELATTIDLVVNILSDKRQTNFPRFSETLKFYILCWKKLALFLFHPLDKYITCQRTSELFWTSAPKAMTSDLIFDITFDHADVGLT